MTEERFEKQSHNADAGFQPSRGNVTEKYNKRLAEVSGLLYNVNGYSSHKRAAMLEEAMGVPDFPLLFGDILDREMQARYSTVGTPLAPIFRNKVNNDFRPAAIYRKFGGVERLQKVREQDEYKARHVDEERVTIKVDKYGGVIPISWETIINDDMGFFDDLPEDLADSATNTEAWLQTSTLFTTTGPRAAAFTGTGGQPSISNLALSIPNLTAAFQELGAYRDEKGNPIANRARFLIVPPALEATALQILDSPNVVVAGDTDIVRGNVNVPNRYGLQLIVDPWLPTVVTSGTVGDTCWALASDPSMIAGAVFARLRGHENPELWVRSSDAVQIGGAPISWNSGNFTNDTINYRVRHCMGATPLNHLGLWGSTGQ